MGDTAYFSGRILPNNLSNIYWDSVEMPAMQLDDVSTVTR